MQHLILIFLLIIKTDFDSSPKMKKKESSEFSKINLVLSNICFKDTE